MTVGGYIGFSVLTSIIALSVIVIFINFLSDGKPAIGIIAIVVGLLLTASLYSGMRWWYGNTESGKRAIKTQESNFEGGIKRTVKVYDAVGNLLNEWEGTFDVDFSGDEKRILFDDENGLRHVIYFKTGTVIVEEVS